MFLFIYDLFVIRQEFGRKQFPIELVHILLAHTERQCFPVRVDTERKIFKSLVQILTWLFPTNELYFLFQTLNFLFCIGVSPVRASPVAQQ